MEREEFNQYVEEYFNKGEIPEFELTCGCSHAKFYSGYEKLSSPTATLKDFQKILQDDYFGKVMFEAREEVMKKENLTPEQFASKYIVIKTNYEFSHPPYICGFDEIIKPSDT